MQTQLNYHSGKDYIKYYVGSDNYRDTSKNNVSNSLRNFLSNEEYEEESKSNVQGNNNIEKISQLLLDKPETPEQLFIAINTFINTNGNGNEQIERGFSKGCRAWLSKECDVSAINATGKRKWVLHFCANLLFIHDRSGQDEVLTLIKWSCRRCKFF